MQTLISVIIPVYNTEKYLYKCVDSVLNQTHKNIEIFLVDDGSTDNCPQICDDYAQKDSRVKVIHKENGGQGSARNMALEVANGEYTGFVDSDDWIVEDMYEVLLQIAIYRDADIIECGNIIAYNDEKFIIENRKIGLRVMGKNDAMRASIDSSNIITHGPCNKLYKSLVFKKIRFPLNRLLEDTATTYRLIDKSKVIVRIDEAKYYVRVNSSSVSRGIFNLRMEEVIKSYEEMEDFFVKNVEYKDLEHYAFNAKLGVIFTFMGRVKTNKTKEKNEAIRRIKDKCKYILKTRKVLSVKHRVLLFLITYNLPLYSMVYFMTKERGKCTNVV